MGVKMTAIHWTLRFALAAFYAYGAAVHVANMLSMTGFAWPAAPLKWQLLDILYLILDGVVVLGLLRDRRFGLIAFFVAAESQVLLYTVFRDWILDVPNSFAEIASQTAYLDLLVGFHLVTMALVAGSLWRSNGAGRPAQ